MSSDEEENIYPEVEEFEDDSGGVDISDEHDFSALNKFAKCIDENLSNFNYNIEDGTISIDIPTSVLPITQSISYGFHVKEKLLQFTIEFDSTPDYTKMPRWNCSNPVQGENFIGKALVIDAVEKFFKPEYVKKKHHPSVPILFRLGKLPTSDTIAQLVAEGFDKNATTKVLANTGNINAARDFLLTGKANSGVYDIPVPYDNCPLMYLLVDVVDAFYKLSYCCYICGVQLPQPCIKPTACSNEKCLFRSTQIGLGNSVIHEIKRDPLAADFVISAFANCLGSRFMNPKPPQDIANMAKEVLSSLPKMKDLADECASDAELNTKIGQKAVDVLKYVLFTNRNQFISLLGNLRIQLDIKEFNPAELFQFLTLTADQSKETVFQALKKKHGSRFVWHGSHHDRWYPIFHNGLIDASGANANLQANGKAYGPGIYFGLDADTSWGYVPNQIPQNIYSNSSFPQFSCIALCEVANVPELKNFSWGNTLTNESACIVRFLIIGKRFEQTISSLNIPTYDSVLREIAKRK